LRLTTWTGLLGAPGMRAVTHPSSGPVRQPWPETRTRSTWGIHTLLAHLHTCRVGGVSGGAFLRSSFPPTASPHVS
jgi:hypothetical protein